MEMKQVYEALEKVENGADLIAAIKGEINTLNNEAKKHRTAGEQSATKLKSILEAVGLDDGDDVVDKAKRLKTTLDQFAQGGKKPDEVAKQITDLTAQVGKVTKQLADMTETAKAEKTKRLDGMKMAKAVELLTKGNAASLFFTHKNTPQPAWLRGFFHGDPGGIRTPDPRLRRPLLYPTELLNHINLERAMGIEPTTSAWKAEVLPLNYTRANGRSGRIRTCDTLLPRQVRYQTALHPEYKRYYTI